MHYFPAMDDGAVERALADWKAAWPDMGVLALVPESEKDGGGRLQAAAGRIAAGDFAMPVRLGGADELAGLARAFDTMQQQLMLREQALAAARDELEQRVEQRVEQRTRELNDSNFRLLHEIAEHNAAEEQLRLLSLAVEQTPVGVMITDVAGHIQYVNRSFVESTGYSRAETILPLLIRA